MDITIYDLISPNSMVSPYSKDGYPIIYKKWGGSCVAHPNTIRELKDGYTGIVIMYDQLESITTSTKTQNF